MKAKSLLFGSFIFFFLDVSPNHKLQCLEQEFPVSSQEQNELKNSSDCAVLTRHFEKKCGIPNGLLFAIAKVESRCCPWAVNHAKASMYFKNMGEAAKYVSAKEDFCKNISIGCMQINWPIHRLHFLSLKDALTPYINIQFAAELLCKLFERYGSWEKAVCWYNPKNQKPNYKYWEKVLGNWVFVQNS